jgi:hypothetical protein
MSGFVQEVGSDAVNMTATTTVTAVKGIIGLIVSQASATPTVKIADGSKTYYNTFTPEAGRFYPVCCEAAGGTCTVTISGTVDATLVFSR